MIEASTYSPSPAAARSRLQAGTTPAQELAQDQPQRMNGDIGGRIRTEPIETLTRLSACEAGCRSSQCVHGRCGTRDVHRSAQIGSHRSLRLPHPALYRSARDIVKHTRVKAFGPGRCNKTRTRTLPSRTCRRPAANCPTDGCQGLPNSVRFISHRLNGRISRPSNPFGTLASIITSRPPGLSCAQVWRSTSM